jgi:hypothetical protein
MLLSQKTAIITACEDTRPAQRNYAYNLIEDLLLSKMPSISVFLTMRRPMEVMLKRQICVRTRAAWLHNRPFIAQVS